MAVGRCRGACRSPDFHVDSPALASFAILEMCLSIARWFRDDGARTAEQVADEYADFALRIVRLRSRPGPYRPAGRSRGLMTGSSERTTVTSEAGPDVALTLSAGTAAPGRPCSVSASPGAAMFTRTRCALLAGEGMPARPGP